jgi:hypothetical protein
VDNTEPEIEPLIADRAEDPVDPATIVVLTEDTIEDI